VKRLRRLAEAEMVLLDQLITVAVAENIARLDAEARYRARKGCSEAGGRLAGAGAHGTEFTPVEGDEVCDLWP
jgi:hypothetical protein